MLITRVPDVVLFGHCCKCIPAQATVPRPLRSDTSVSVCDGRTAVGVTVLNTTQSLGFALLSYRGVFKLRTFPDLSKQIGDRKEKDVLEDHFNAYPAESLDYRHWSAER
ncbi:unnamed protein product [Dibothriocephalus latus]|uniref:Uncharacterized protein n=1 Tax=Dibothriocephalus latus TaxID=60516 RepID=A0A3P6T9G0_DIBLA|nr:unnamed protein product [Dibothriocephalus latus]